MSRTTSRSTAQAASADGVRLEYQGKNAGAIPFTGPSGKVYRGGRSASNRFIVVTDPDDLAYLLGLKWFKRAPLAEAEAAEGEELDEEAALKAALEGGVIEQPIQVDEAVIVEAAVEDSKPRRQASQKD